MKQFLFYISILCIGLHTHYGQESFTKIVDHPLFEDWAKQHVAVTFTIRSPNDFFTNDSIEHYYLNEYKIASNGKINRHRIFEIVTTSIFDHSMMNSWPDSAIIEDEEGFLHAYKDGGKQHRTYRLDAAGEVIFETYHNRNVQPIYLYRSALILEEKYDKEGKIIRASLYDSKDITSEFAPLYDISEIHTCEYQNNLPVKIESQIYDSRVSNTNHHIAPKKVFKFKSNTYVIEKPIAYLKTLLSNITDFQITEFNSFLKQEEEPLKLFVTKLSEEQSGQNYIKVEVTNGAKKKIQISELKSPSVYIDTPWWSSSRFPISYYSLFSSYGGVGSIEDAPTKSTTALTEYIFDFNGGKRLQSYSMLNKQGQLVYYEDRDFGKEHIVYDKNGAILKTVLNTTRKQAGSARYNKRLQRKYTKLKDKDPSQSSFTIIDYRIQELEEQGCSVSITYTH